MSRAPRSSCPVLVAAGFALAILGVSGCSTAGPSGGPTAVQTASADVSVHATAPAEQRFPDVVAVEIQRTGEDSYDLSVTLSSPYDTPERYADGWRVLAPDGATLGEHQLGHDHADEQPFTRSQTGLRIPGDVDEVTVEGRDQANGYGGGTVAVKVPRASA